MYFVKTPGWLKRIFPAYIWDIPTGEKKIYLTFDDGPHPAATPFVLDQLAQYNAKATFFCIGKNIINEPHLFEQIKAGGHGWGNHTNNHLNGWKTDKQVYTDNVMTAAAIISSSLFRPPYGRITKQQALLLKSNALIPNGFKIIMWDVLSGDFDKSITPQKCLNNVIKHAKSGSIIVFHDSTKAFDNLYYTLPRVLEYFSKGGYIFDKIDF